MKLSEKLQGKKLSHEQTSALYALNGIATAMGVNIVIFDSKGEGISNGYYNPKNDTIYIDITAGLNKVDGTLIGEYAIMRTMSHELTHWLRVHNEAGYLKLRKFIFQKLADYKGKSLETMIQEEMRDNSELNRDGAEEEVVARACEMMLKNSTAVQQLCETHQSLGQQIKSFISDFLNNIKKAFEKLGIHSDAAKGMEKYMSELQQLWDHSLVVASMNNNIETKNTAESSGIKAEQRKNTAADIDLYTEKQYNYYGWVRVNNVLSAEDYSQFKEYYSDNKNLKFKYPKTPKGETIIPIGKNSNKLVFVSGSFTEPKISQVISINSEYNFEIEEIRSEIIEKYQSGYRQPLQYVQNFTREGLLVRESRQDFGTRSELKRQRERSISRQSAGNSTIGQNRRRGNDTNNENDTEGLRLKLERRDTEYLNLAKDPEANAEKLQKMVDEAASDAGYTIKAYHGTGRADRVGNVFLPERATSGPMAFFTDNREIAEHYAKDKQDTSIAYDSDYDSYYTQFRTKVNGKDVAVSKLWNTLSFAERNKIKENAKHITLDDDAETIIYDEAAQHGNGAWDDYTLNMHRGNAIDALVDVWLESGELWEREADFINVLKMAGINGVEYKDPDYREEKVYDTYLDIQKPFDTAEADQKFADSFTDWYWKQDKLKYSKGTANADMWDKNNRTGYEWVHEKLLDDIENGTSYAWTSIPDSVSDYLKSLGYDGIKDRGGKNGGESHTVWVPFSSEQIKSADPVTYDDNGNIIPLSERFSEDNPDIRYERRENAAITKSRVELQRDNDRLRELVNILRTPGASRQNFTEASIERAAKKILNAYQSGVTIRELKPILRKYYSFIATAEELNNEDVNDKALEIADEIFAKLKPSKENLDAGDEILLEALKKNKIYVNEAALGEAANKYGGRGEFFKKWRGKINFTYTQGANTTSLDEFWTWNNDVLAQYVDGTEGDTLSDAEMAFRLVEIYDSIKAKSAEDVNFTEHFADNIKQSIADSIRDGFWEATEEMTALDRQRARYDKLKARHTEYVESSKARYDELKRLKAQHTEYVESSKARYDELKRLNAERRKAGVESRRKTEIKNSIRKTLVSVTGLEPVTPTKQNFRFMFASKLEIRMYSCVLSAALNTKIFSLVGL